MNIEQIQATVDAERAALAALDAKLTDSGLHKEIQQARFWLDDVEVFFLRSARQDQRTPEQLERWLSYSVMPLEMAIKGRKKLEATIAKYGPNAVTI
jgi:hypothetical protein